MGSSTRRLLPALPFLLLLAGVAFGASDADPGGWFSWRSPFLGAGSLGVVVSVMGAIWAKQVSALHAQIQLEQARTKISQERAALLEGQTPAAIRTQYEAIQKFHEETQQGKETAERTIEKQKQDIQELD